MLGRLTGPHHFRSMKIEVSEDFSEPSFKRGGVQSFCRLLAFWSNNRLFKKGMVAIPFFNFLLLWVLVDVSIYKSTKKRGWQQKPLKRFFLFCHPLLKRTKRVKRRERPEV